MAASNVQPEPLDPPSVRATAAWRRAIGAFVLGLLFLLLVAGAGLLAWDASYEGRILPGVRIGQTDLSGLDRPAAAGAVSAALGHYGNGRIVIGTDAGDVSVAYDSFARRPDVDVIVDQALSVGRSGSALERAIAQVEIAIGGRSVEPAVVFDEEALRAEIEGVLRGLEREPADARIRMEPHGILTTLSRQGRTFDPEAVHAAAVEAVGTTDAPAEVRIQATAVPIAPAIGDDVVLAARQTAQRMIADVVVTGLDKRWKIRARKVRSWISFEAADGTVRPVIDEAAIPKSLRRIAKKVVKKPVSATYLRSKGGRIVGVAAGHRGRKLDVAATTAAIVAMLERRGTGAPVEPVAATIAKVAPKLTTAEAQKKGPLMTRLGSWKTYFPISERNYFGANIWLPAAIIDGTVLQPGQRFEWWSALGPVTRERGFGLGGYIAGNRTDPTGAMGGGMCSASTTLFNAALRAGLQMGARDNHRYYIDRYPLGLDATVSSAQTMSFTNDMKNPVVIRGFKVRSGSSGWVRFEIWGIDDGRTVQISKPSARNVRKATTKTVYVSTLPKGVREQTEYPANGMDVSVTRIVRKNGKVLHRDTYRSPYQLWHGRIEIGR